MARDAQTYRAVRRNRAKQLRKARGKVGNVGHHMPRIPQAKAKVRP